MRKLILTLIAVLIASPVGAAQKTVVFPFDMRDAGQAGEIVPQYNPEDLRRLKLIAGELSSLMDKDERYEIMDTSAVAADIEKAHPFSACDGCDREIAQKMGADLAVTGFVDKLSDALISLQLFVRDVKTGDMVKTMSAEVRGNTDELWLHGLRWLWRNRFKPEEKKN